MENSTNEKPIIYLLSTCPRCKNLKKVLEEEGVECEKISVDLLARDERDKIVEELRKHKSVVSFPVIQAGEEYIFSANADDVHRLFGEKS